MKIAAGLIQVLWMVAGPLAVAAILRQRWRVPWSVWGAGATGFILSQLVHLPILWAIGGHYPKDVAWLAALLGLLAGLCEEPARYLVFRFWLKDARDFRSGVIAGLGHGGIESVVLGLLVLAGLLGSLAVSPDDPAAWRAGAAATLEAAPLLRLGAALERLSAVTFHVAMSILVMAAAQRRSLAILGVAISAHAAFDAAAVWAARTHGFWAAEGVAGLGALLGLFVLLHGHAAARRRDAAARDVVDRVIEPLPDQALSARALTKEFAPRTAVDALTFDVPRGQIFALLGPNGAGKTTTVRMLCALIPPTRGTARVAGALLVREEEALRRHIGILTETPGLYERLTAYENLELFGRLYGLAPQLRRARIEQHLRAFGLWDRRDDAVGGFSKGMKQKIAIVRSLLHEPDVLFLDEPTSGLDPIASREVHGMIRALKAQGRTILLTTHRLAEAEELADLVGIVRGKLLALDTFASLRAQLFGQQLEVRVANPSDAVQAAIALRYGEAARWQGELLTLGVADPVQEAPALVRALVEAAADVITVREVAHSLEEIYLEHLQERP